MSTSPTAPICRPPGSFAQPSTRRYGFGNACASASAAQSSRTDAAAARKELRALGFMSPSKSVSARRAPAFAARFCFRAEPALASALVDLGFVIRPRAEHVVDALALAVDVAFDGAAAALPSRCGIAVALRLPRRSDAFVRRIPLLAAVRLGRRELAGPDAAACRTRFALLIDVVVAVPAVGERKTRPHHRAS